METFPLADRQDAKYYQVEQEDPAMRTEMEGGYVYSRPRFTRTPRKTFTTGFTNLSNDEKNTLEAFWNTVKGGSEIFQWTDPVENVVVEVRFTAPIQFNYAGYEGNHRWDCSSIVLEQV